MNFLAHVHLSPDDKDVRIGSFIADSVKGKSYMQYNNGIIKGIKLHRDIDTFTDKHPVVVRSRTILREYFGKFSGVVTDIYYDHFLARNWENYSREDLADFTSKLYWELSLRFVILPARIKRILPFLISQNWLCGYANLNDLARVFNGMDRRTGYISGMENAIEVLKYNYKILYADFSEYYPALQKYVSELLKSENSK